jgi:hypothetical protein
LRLCPELIRQVFLRHLGERFITQGRYHASDVRILDEFGYSPADPDIGPILYSGLCVKAHPPSSRSSPSERERNHLRFPHPPEGPRSG